MEEWARWEPLQGLSGGFSIKELQMSHVGVRIVLFNENSGIKIEIWFDGPTYAYRCTNESLCFGIFPALGVRYGHDFYIKWSFFKISNSEYLEWVASKTTGSIDDYPLDHFCIVGNDEIIDVLANYEPSVRVIE